MVRNRTTAEASRRERAWIPPLALIAAQLASGFSWLLIILAAGTGSFENSLYRFAWIHTVALGWITMAALAILIFALPNFIDTRWRAEATARWSFLAYATGVALLIFGFLRNVAILPVAGAILLGALLVYLATAFATIAGAMRGERIQRAVARAFGFTFLFLFATAVIGAMLAAALPGRFAISQRLPLTHANLGTIGWITLLIFGVSMRTFKPITGSGGTRFRWIHIVSGSAGGLGAVLLAANVYWIGGALFALAAIVYVFDAFDILLRSRNPHRPPQAFIAASLLWLLYALWLGAGVITGKPWQSAYMFVLLMGWAGQMVNAHLHHIGIRLLATIYRGDDDETQPQELLETRLSWYTFFSFQLAIAVVTVALLGNNETLAARGAICGVTAWIAMVANVLIARMRAKGAISGHQRSV